MAEQMKFWQSQVNVLCTYKNLSYCSYSSWLLVTNILCLLQIFCFWNPLWSPPFVDIKCVTVFVFCDCVKISLWLRFLMHSLLVKSLNLFSARIFHNFPKCKILKGKKSCFKEWYGLVLQALKLCYLIFLSSLAGDISPLLPGRWCLNGKQRDERKWSSTGSCQTDALWNATELVWSIISPSSITENIDKVSPQKVESSRWEN